MRRWGSNSRRGTAASGWGAARHGEATGEWLWHVEVEQDAVAVAAGTKVVPVDVAAAADAVPLTRRRPPIGPLCCRW